METQVLNQTRRTRRISGVVVPTGWVVGGTAVIWAANQVGLWWVTALVGVAIGLALRGTPRIIAAASLAAVAGWGLAMLWQSLGADIGGAAATVALIMGFGRSGVIVILLALIFAWLLALAGAWLGAAARRAIPQVTSRPDGG
jgi:hypothetical protein